jgi:ABC-type microcin C transport system duplicated ATPase subunit YejF
MIFQDPFSSLNPKFTIAQILAEPLEIHKTGTPNQIKAKVSKFIKLVGLSDEDLKRYPHQFSGGQRQRICIARALIIEPDIIVCDEPVSALDVSIQAQILELLKELQKKLNLTYLFITHDLRVVKYIADEMIVLQNGNLVELGAVNQVFKNPKTKYTQTLINSIPGSI